MNQLSTTQETEVRYTAHLVHGFRGAILSGGSDIIGELRRMLDASASHTAMARFTLARLAAALIIIQEFSKHLYDSSAPQPAGLEALHRHTTRSLSAAMAGRSLNELNTAEYKPAEGGEWRQSIPTRLSQDKVTGRWIATDAAPIYRFRSATRLELSEVLAPALRRSYV